MNVTAFSRLGTLYCAVLWPSLLLWSLWSPTGASAAALEQRAEHPRLVRSQVDVFVIDRGKRRWVVSPQVFTDYRFREEWIEQLSDDELSRIGRGPDLVAGPVLRAPDGEIWVVYQGTRRRIAGPDAYAPLYLSPDDAMPASEEEIASYPIGRPIGNPPRRWLIGVVTATLAFAAWLLWQSVATAQDSESGTASRRWGLAPSWLGLGALFVATGMIKAYYVSMYPWLPDGADANSYVTVARYLAGGGSLLDDGPFGGLTGVTSPLYPMILALISPATAVVGGSVVGWKLVQVAIAAALVPLVADVTRRLYGRAAARAAAVITAVSPLWLYSAELLQYELWLALFLTAGTWGLVRAVDSPSRRRLWLLLAGISYGLAVFLQLKVVAVLIPASAFVLWQHARFGRIRTDATDRQGTHRALRWPAAVPSLTSLALFAVPAALPVGAWGLRNVAVHGEPLLGSTAAGIIFWMGNHPGATGGIMQIPRPNAFYERVGKYPEQSITRETRAFSELAIEHIRRHPSHFLLLSLTKLERFWWTITPDRLGEYLEGRTLAFLGGTVDRTALTVFSKLAHVLSLVLAAAGVIGGARLQRQAGARTSAGRYLLIASVVAFWLVHIPFISESRYRIPIAGFLQVFEGAGLVVLCHALRRRPREADTQARYASQWSE